MQTLSRHLPVLEKLGPTVVGFEEAVEDTVRYRIFRNQRADARNHVHYMDAGGEFNYQAGLIIVKSYQPHSSISAIIL
jgi:hypothetical protein